MTLPQPLQLFGGTFKNPKFRVEKSGKLRILTSTKAGGI